MILLLKFIIISQMYLFSFFFLSYSTHCSVWINETTAHSQRSHGYIKEIMAEELLTAVSYITLHPVAWKLILGD